ncbi:MAG: Hpt domain-containing protein [Polyangiaceae bacterium]
MTEKDPELARLLVAELTRHLEILRAEETDAETVRRSVHALKGSAGLAGERELARVLERIERAMRSGDGDVREEAVRMVAMAAERIARGESGLAAEWPEPDDALVEAPYDPAANGNYASEVRDRLSHIDEAMSASVDPTDTVSVVYRHVHTIKGAAGAVGHDAMSWFCHGLEDRLRQATSREGALLALEDMRTWRGVLGGLLDDPHATLRSLRAMAGRRKGAVIAPSRVPLAGGVDDVRATAHRDEGGATIRVSASSVDKVLELVETIGVSREELASRFESAESKSEEMRRVRTSLADALRLIGPPKPWGAPATAIDRIQSAILLLDEHADGLGQDALALRFVDQALRESGTRAKRELSMMRLTSLGGVFARMTSAIEAESRRAERTVIVRTTGAAEMLDRRIAEQLIEPCLQVVRNAIAHGIEAPDVRAAAGKAKAGTITLSARRLHNRLRIDVEDDGSGVDIAKIRQRAIDEEIVLADIAEAADDDTLLALLFLPGFSTRDSSDLLAGRGIGLDIVRSAILRLGGTIHLSSRPGAGFSVRLDVPVESGLARVLWVRAGGDEYALAAANAKAVLPASEAGARVPHLAECLTGGAAVAAPFAVEFGIEASDGRERRYRVGVDSIGAIEEVLVRPLPPLVSGLGPYAGGILKGDRALRLAIDAYALAPRARALGNVPDRVSDPPPAPPSGRP